MFGAMRKGFIAAALFCALILFSSAVGAATASATLSAGSVIITAPPANFSYSGTLSGDVLNLSSSFAVSVNDPSGTHAGWNLQASIGVLTAADSSSIPASAHTIQSVALSNVTGTAPVDNIIYPLAIPTATGKIFSANANTGSGKSTMTFTTQLAVPADASAGSYSATLTVSIVSGP
jgi:hypothetical protein